MARSFLHYKTPGDARVGDSFRGASPKLHKRGKSADIDSVTVSDLFRHEQAEIVVMPTQIELNQAKRIATNIKKTFKFKAQLAPPASLLARLAASSKAVLSKEDFARIFPKFSEAAVGHLTSVQKELLKYTIADDLQAVKETLGKLEYGDCDFSAQEIGPPLYWAVKNKNLAMVSLLLERGANANRPTKNGEISLHEACRKGCREVGCLQKIVEQLIQYRANVYHKNNSGDTAFHVAHYSLFADEAWIQKMECLYLNNPWLRK